MWQRVRTPGYRLGGLGHGVLILLSWCAVEAADRQTAALPQATPKGVTVSNRATGSFEVQLTPQAMNVEAKNGGLSRMSLRKQFSGDLAGTSEGEMLAAMTAVDGSAGYVAIERVSGRLEDRDGAFVLQHSGTMTRGAQQLLITVVPDSGTGNLEGLAGTMTIQIIDGRHSYAFEYSLPPLRRTGQN